MIDDDSLFREKLKRAYGSADTAPEASPQATNSAVLLTPDEVQQAEQEQERVRARLRSAAA